MMKAWYISDQEWRDVEETDYIGGADKDGYCTCPSCQEQKSAEKNKLPDKLFEL